MALLLYSTLTFIYVLRQTFREVIGTPYSGHFLMNIKRDAFTSFYRLAASDRGGVTFSQCLAVSSYLMHTSNDSVNIFHVRTGDANTWPKNLD